MDFANLEQDTKYEYLTIIGEGTYGPVFKVQHSENRRTFALKKILAWEWDFPKTTLREIKSLQVLRHENIVSLVEFCRSINTFSVIFDLYDHNLAGLLASNIRFSQGEMKGAMRQILQGLMYIHDNGIMHRDIKPSNIFVTKDGIMKIANFQLARRVLNRRGLPSNRLRSSVTTLIYRPPEELLLGSSTFGTSVDMWSAGCVMGEIFTRKPLMKGRTRGKLLKQILRLCGSKVNGMFDEMIQDPFGSDLLKQLLKLDPRERITAKRAVYHIYFLNHPEPCDLSTTLAHVHSG